MFREKNQQVSNPKPGDNSGYPSVAKGEMCWVEGQVSETCRIDAKGQAITPPVVEYGPEIGRIVSGVAAVRGPNALPFLADKVLVADWEGELLVATPGAAPWSWQQLDTSEAELTGTLWDLDTDADGNVYLMMTNDAMSSGSILKLVAG